MKNNISFPFTVFKESDSHLLFIKKLNLNGFVSILGDKSLARLSDGVSGLGVLLAFKILKNREFSAMYLETMGGDGGGDGGGEGGGGGEVGGWEGTCGGG